MKATQPRGWRAVIEEPFPDFKPNPKVWPKGPTMDGIRTVFTQEQFEARRKKALKTPLP